MNGFAGIITGTGADRVLELTGHLTIEFSEEILNRLRAAFDGAERIWCEVSRVTEIDLIGLQLLCAAHRTAVKQNKLFGICGDRPGAIRASMDAAGLTRHTGCSFDRDTVCIWTDPRRAGAGNTKVPK
jgi:ABC-type transporter Mla MlaB component